MGGDEVLDIMFHRYERQLFGCGVEELFAQCIVSILCIGSFVNEEVEILQIWLEDVWLGVVACDNDAGWIMDDEVVFWIEALA